MKIAIICPVFWPHGTVGARRVTAWARRWVTQHGDRVQVLTRRYPHLEIREGQQRGEELPDGVGVQYLTVSDSTSDAKSRLRAFQLVLARALLVPDVSVRSWRKVTNDVLQALEVFTPDVILSTSPPHSVHLTASATARRLNVPWVADFRDAYLGDPAYGVAGSRRLRSSQHHAVEKHLYSDASLVVHTHEMQDIEQRKRYPNLQNKFIQIPNGVSNQFLDALKSRDRTVQNPRLVVVGSCGKPELKSLVDAVLTIPELELHYAGLDTLSATGEHPECQRIVHHGLLSETGVASLLGSADIIAIPQDVLRRNLLCSTSRLPEAMSTGKPLLLGNPQRNDVILLKRFYPDSHRVVEAPRSVDAWRRAIAATRSGEVLEASQETIRTVRREFSRERQADCVRAAVLQLTL